LKPLSKKCVVNGFSIRQQNDSWKFTLFFDLTPFSDSSIK